jgi:hypothetical protein
MMGGRHRLAWQVAIVAASTALLGVGTQPASEPTTTAAADGAGAYLPDASLPFVEYADRWPARYGRPSQSGVQGVTIDWGVAVSRLMPDRPMSSDRAPTELDELDFARLVKGRTESTQPASGFELEDFRSLTFRLGSEQEARNKGFGKGPARAAGPDASMVFRFVSGEESSTKPGKVEIQRTWFAYYAPIAVMTAEERRQARRAAREGTPPQEEIAETIGVIMLMPGLYGTPEPIFDAMTLKLRESGFGVLRMLAQPSRFTERVRIELDPASMESDATKVAATLTNRAAECAYAVEGAWKHLETVKPELAKLPKAIMGTSGGGMTLPVVYAREPERYSAAVLIGSAADLWLIARRSAYTHDASSVAVTIKGVKGPAPEGSHGFDWAAFDGLYLKHAALDPFHTARSMQGRKVLMFHGETDRAVPAELADVLWERLGKPERWSYPTGHEGLIIELLPRETNKIIAWMKGSMGIETK